MRHTVTWNGDADVSRLSGRPVRLQMEMQDSDLYAFQFVSGLRAEERLSSAER
jgi:hypothetical protein